MKIVFPEGAITFSNSECCIESGKLCIECSEHCNCGALPWNEDLRKCCVIPKHLTALSGLQVLWQWEQGTPIKQALNINMVENRVSKYRQVAVIDAGGTLRTPVAAKYSVFGTWGTWGSETTVSKQAKYWRVVINAFNTVFEATPGEITTRLLAALQAGIDSGGEVESEQSAAVKVVNDYALPVVNWRVGWVDQSHGQSLKQLMKAYEPQMNAYDSSAFKPFKSENNGAHGDE